MVSGHFVVKIELKISFKSTVNQIIITISISSKPVLNELIPVFRVAVEAMRPSGVSAMHVYLPACEALKQSTNNLDLVEPTRNDGAAVLRLS